MERQDRVMGSIAHHSGPIKQVTKTGQQKAQYMGEQRLSEREHQDRQSALPAPRRWRIGALTTDGTVTAARTALTSPRRASLRQVLPFLGPALSLPSPILILVTSPQTFRPAPSMAIRCCG